MKNKIATITLTVAAASSLISGIVAAQTPLPTVPPSTAGFSEAGLSRIDQFFEREIADKRVPGAVIAIARDGKLVHYKSYGKLSPETSEPMPLEPSPAIPSTPAAELSPIAVAISLATSIPFVALTEFTLVEDSASIIADAIAEAIGETAVIFDRA